MALHDVPLFDEDIVAWEHGPVVIPLYRKYRQYGAGPIPPDEINLEDFRPELRELLDEVYSVYGQFSASKLRALTHAEPPWQETLINGVISHDLMQRYFKTQLAA